MAKQNKSRKLFATTATAALVASALAPAAAFAAEDVKFGDAGKIAGWAKESVDYLVGKGAIKGDDKGNFNPEGNLTRAEAATILVGALDLKVDDNAKTTFKDAENHWSSKFIAALQAHDSKIISGYTDGTFKPDGKITRQELATIVVNAYGLKADDNAKLGFTDNNGWGKEYVNTLASLGIVAGQSATKFAPDALVTRQEAAAFVHRTEVPEKRVEVEKVITDATKVTSVSATNLKEVVVTFDGTVDEETATDKANYSLKSGKAIKSVALAADEKTVTITVVGTLANNKADAVTVSNVKAGDKTIDAKDVEFTTVDNVLPEVTEIKSLGTKSVKVSFSEPVEDLKSGNFTLDGKAYFGNVAMGAGNKSVILTPYSNTALAVGEHTLTVTGVKDYAGFVSLNSTHDFTVVEDTVAPTITEVTATLESVTITFSEDVDPSTISASKVYWKSGDSKKTATGTPEALADNKYKFTFSTANTLPTGTVDIYVEGVKDYSGNEIAKDTKVSVTPEIDQTRPEVRKVSVNNAAGTEIKVTFSKAINADSAKIVGNYTVTDSKGKVVSVSDARLDPNDSKSVIVSLYRALTVGENEIIVKNVKDATKLQNTMLDFTGTVVKSDVEAPTYDYAVNREDRQVVLKFDKKMDIDTLTDFSNYLVRIDGTQRTLTPAIADITVLHDSSAVVITFAETISDKEVKFATGTAASGDTHVSELAVLGLKDTNGNLVKEFAENGIGGVTNIVPLHVDTRVALAEFDSVDHPNKVAELVDTKTIEVKFDTGINAAETGAFVAKVNGSVVAIEDVVVDGSSTVTLKFKEALKTDAAGLTIDVDYTKLVNIAGNKGVATPGIQITPAGLTYGLLDSVAPTHQFATGETEYEVSGNTIVITYSEALQELVAGNQDLIDTDFTVTRVSDNTKLNPIGEYDANVVGNKVVITLADTRAAATAYTVTVKDAKYFADLTGNEIADTTGKSKLVASSASSALAAAKTAAATAKTDAATAKTAHTAAGGLTTDAEYAAVEAAITALDTAVASDVTADIVAATTTLNGAVTALEAATAVLVADNAALATAKANAATAKSAATTAKLAHLTAGGFTTDAEYVAVEAAITALDTAVASDVTADIVTATTALETAVTALEAATALLP